MGGYGSGRSGGCSRQATDDLRALDIRWLNRSGLLKPGGSITTTWSRNGTQVASIAGLVYEDKLVLNYSVRDHAGEWEQVNYPVYFDRTDCHIGGKRIWFLCSGKGCGRRVAVLYGGKYFLCRHCQDLAYSSQREQAYDRTLRKADRIRKKLGWEPGVFNGHGGKPKGMHWQTYWRLQDKCLGFEQSGLAGAMARLRTLYKLCP